MRRLAILSLLFLSSLVAQGVFEKRIAPVDARQAQNFPKQSKVALLIGVSAYPSASGFESLHYAAKDVKELETTLTQQGYTVSLLMDADATRGAIVRTLHQVAETVESNNGTLLFYFSGHGYSIGSQPFLAPVSASEDDLEREGLAVDEVTKIMAASKAQRKVLMLDACRSESKVKGANGRSFSSLAAASGFLIFNSTKIGGVSYESDSLGHGVFSAFVLKGLDGAAAGADGLVTFRDLAAYVTDSMVSWGLVNHKEQAPYEAVGPGEVTGEFLLAANVPRLPVTSVPATVTQPYIQSPIMKRAEQLFSEKLFTQALPLYQQAGVSDSLAMFRLGTLYRGAIGVTRDYQQALLWCRKAADAGNADATECMGELYFYGQGVPTDYQEALTWFRKAADMGQPDAMDFIGVQYARGNGVKQDDEQAMVWYQKGAAAGNANAMFNVGFHYQEGRGVAQDYKQALTWFLKGAEAGSPKAIYNVGWFYERGFGVTQDYGQAMIWLRKAAEAGNLKAINAIGEFYRDGRGVKQDYEQAMIWFRRGSAAGGPNATNSIGMLYENGLGVKADRNQAIEWYRKAAAMNNLNAKENLKRLRVTP